MAPRTRRAAAAAVEEMRRAKKRRHLRGKSPRRFGHFGRFPSCEPINVPELLYGHLDMEKHGQGSADTPCLLDGSDVSSLTEGWSSSVGTRAGGNRGTACDSSEVGDSSQDVSDRQSTMYSADNESLTEATEASRTSRGSSSTSTYSRYPKEVNSAMLAKGTGSSREKKSLVRVINTYLRTMVQQSKRRAQYIYNALSFGVYAGYLMPCDPQGKVLCVSSSLLRAGRKANPASRARRRRLRRGEDEKVDERKKLDPGSTVWPAKKQDTQDNDEAQPSTSKKRRRSKTNASKTRNRAKTVKKPKKSVIEEAPSEKTRGRAKKLKAPIVEKPSKARRGGKREGRITRGRSEPFKDIDKLRAERRPDVSDELDNRVREDRHCRDDRVADEQRFNAEEGRSSLGRGTRFTTCEKIADSLSLNDQDAGAADGDGTNDVNLEEMSNENDRNATDEA